MSEPEHRKSTRKSSRLLREVMDQTRTDDTRTEAAAEFILTLSVDGDKSCGCFLLAAMKILRRSADFQGFHPLTDHYKEIERIMDALWATPETALASARLQ